MKVGIRIAVVCAVLVLAMQWARAADSAPVLAVQGKQLFADDFARTEMAPKWRVGKGFVTVADGVASFAENPDDHHGAYAYVTPNFEFKDIVAEFSVKMDGAKMCSLMVNDTKYKQSHAGHILKATILATGKLNLADWKFGMMKTGIYEKVKDPATPADEKKKLFESIKDTTAEFEADADLSQWHVVRAEIVGDELLVSIDGKPAGYLKSAGIDHPTKNAIGFEVGGKSALIKDVKVWEATASPDWAGQRDAVIGSLSK